ncbi:MAG TPA: CRISPR-associated endonuclease Cas2 [Candidatus Enterosoma merdigallinarum]|nr:CRISPR-associated endonuclease Cas2 [Candidatus Enterosoma merdigallinarum]
MSNYRYMRTLLMFDLPVVTAIERRHYRQFVKFIKSIGFIMFQESIYVKLSVNGGAIEKVKKAVEAHLPPKGMVSLLTVTEKQFGEIDNLLGEFVTDIVHTDNRLVEL